MFSNKMYILKFFLQRVFHMQPFVLYLFFDVWTSFVWSLYFTISSINENISKTSVIGKCVQSLTLQVTALYADQMLLVKKKKFLGQ